MTVEEATNIIYNNLYFAYCDNCRGNDDDGRRCDECCRKMQNWAVSRYTAECIARKILGE